MNLIIDIGNTKGKLGLFDRQGEMVLHAEFVTKAGLPMDVIDSYDVKKIMYCATGRLPVVCKQQMDGLGQPIELTHHTRLPIQMLYKTPETIGRDRIAAVCGAWALFPEETVLIIDAGTCITYEVLLKGGLYIGGNISPGFNMRLRAMHDYTAGLPLVSFSLPKNPIGEDTESALQNGALRGAILEIRAFIARIKRKYGPIRIILTGGDAFFLDVHIKNKTFVDRDLVLKGMNTILEYE